MGIDEGSTGSQISVACAGSCGTVAPNPMDVVVVADRTRSMLVPFGCTKGSPGCRDYRSDLVSGIKGLLQVMTPEQQFVALGALGPSALTRSNAEGKTCNSTQKGLVYPNSNESAVAGSGSWVPIAFKKDYLGAADINGVRAVNTNSALLKAIECLDDVEPNTRTALASPLKSAARYLLGKPGDENNVSSLGGGDRSGTIKKVIIFETDGQPWENYASTSAGSLSLDNNQDVFSKYTDNTTSTTSSGPTLGSVQNGTPRNVSPAPPSPYNDSATYPTSYSTSGHSYSYTYKYRTSVSSTTTTYTATGGQKACQNFKQIASLAKASGILIITIGYNINGSIMCSGENTWQASPGSNTSTNNPWISDIQPTACRNSGSGTQASPYTKKTSCAQNMTITYTVPQDIAITANAQGLGDESVTNTLAAASGGGDVPNAVSNGCGNATDIAAENADEDLFFCAAQGQDMAPLFVTALSKVTSGVKLMNLP
jgi:hypothetical protein